MTLSNSLDYEAQRSLNRLIPRLEDTFAENIVSDPKGWQVFLARLNEHFSTLFRLYFRLYHTRYDFFYHLEDLVVSLAKAWFARPLDLREQDEIRGKDPRWFQSHKMVGGVIYIDLFADDLSGVRAKIPYFQELGLTYLHLMPFFKMPVDENDGGYTVSSYREVHPPLGTMEQLADLARDLRAANITLVADLVFNHTSKEHAWAKRAMVGEIDFQEMYHIFPDRQMPDAYERSLREIFPEEHPGQFTYCETLKSWVWTTFHNYQWDLNYANPAVFNRMADELFFLANQGVEVLRLDAVAFIWKQMGTNCENLPEAHIIIQVYNAAARIAAPALLFKSEAIVHPDEVVKYISLDECQLSYNPLLMALLWNSLATRKTDLLFQALATSFKLDPGTVWVNYIRCHDDIGWTFSDEDAAALGINGGDHRHFLNEFYRGRFPGSFARGLPFQENVKTGDLRISGTCASLAGLEKALTKEGPDEVGLAIRRIMLIHGIIMTVGGIPLIYLGDEIGTLNDYSYRDTPARSYDSRWVHRSKANWDAYARRSDAEKIEGRVFQGLRSLIKLRKQNPVFSAGVLEVIPTENAHVLGYVRRVGEQRAIIFVNFSESEQIISSKVLAQYAIYGKQCLHGCSKAPSEGQLLLKPLDLLVLK